VSTFYVLPPRPVLAERLSAYLHNLLPGLDWTRLTSADMTDWLAAACRQPDVYVIYREELPAGEEPRQALCDGFGAEAGDEVIEVRSGPRAGEMTARRYRLEG
jgi:hypothetical protein